MLFSIIVRTYNREKIISNTLNSIFKQTYKNYEIIIVDDCSKDQTEQLIKKKYCNKKIKYFKSKKNVGHTRASEFGLNKSKGDILCFLDSDDTWNKNFLQNHYETYSKYPEVSCVYNNTISIINKKKLPTHYSTIEGNCYKQALKQLFISSQIALSFKKQAWLYLKTLDHVIKNEDDDLCLRLSKRFIFKKINKNLSFAHHNNISLGVSTDNIKHAINFELLLMKYKKDIMKYCNLIDISNLYYLMAKKFFLSKNFKKSKSYLQKSIKFHKEKYLKKLLLLFSLKFLVLFFQK
jgi:glycosyltransferase involved in cell wall biosynthesis